MISKIHSIVMAAVLAALLLVGCGGGSGGGQVAGIDRTGSPIIASLGTVTTFGSVVVNGVRYDTSRAQFTIDDRPGSQDDLSVGDVVLVRGTLDSGTTTGVATSVVFDDNVEGPIGSIDLAADTLVVLGQTVRVSPDTSFDDSIPSRSLTGLVVGNVVEISGFVESDGSVRATRIERKTLVGELELTGVVTSHDGVARRFNINAQVVDYSTAQLQDFPAGAIANGQLVEVKAGSVVNGELRATRVEFQGGALAGAAGDRREVEGFITRFVSATDFDVAGVPVTTNGQTVVQGGTLGLNVKVEAEGTLNASGVLVATKVDVRRSAAVRIVALVDSVNAGAGSFVMLGITVKIDALTRLEDKTSQQVRPFTLANLVTSNYVEVRGLEFPAGSGEVLATLVERDDPDSDSELQGFVQTVAQPALTILGVQVSTTGAQFRDVNDAPITATQFFSQLAVGNLVKAKGLEVADRALQANEVEFEN